MDEIDLYWKTFAWIIVIVWLPFSLPLILIGCLVRFGWSSFLFGYDMTEMALTSIWKRALKK